MASYNSNVSATSGPQRRNDGNASTQMTDQEANPDHLTCSICHEEYADTDILHEPVMTYCGHVFGKSCLDAWIAASPNRDCPTCRKGQTHNCGHRCLPRPLADHPPGVPRAVDRLLNHECDGCSECKATLDFLEEELEARMAPRIRPQRDWGYFPSLSPLLEVPEWYLEESPALAAVEERHRRTMEELRGI